MTSDEEIGAMLRAMDDSEAGREGRGGPRLDDAQAVALHARIMALAAKRLADLRHHGTWWDYSAQWSRAAIPVGLAASLVAGALWYGVPRDTTHEAANQATVAASDAAQRVMSVAISRGVGSTEMLDSLVGPVSRDALVAELLGGGR